MLLPLPSARSVHVQFPLVNATAAASEAQEGSEQDLSRIARQGAFAFLPLTGAGVQAAPADITVGVAPTAPPLPAGTAEALFFPMDAVVRVAVDHPVAATVEQVVAAVDTCGSDTRSFVSLNRGCRRCAPSVW